MLIVSGIKCTINHVGTKSVILGNRRFVFRRQRYTFAVRLVVCFVLIMMSTIGVGLGTQANLIWVANGLLLSYLLVTPRWRWPAYIGVAFAAMLAGSAPSAYAAVSNANTGTPAPVAAAAPQPPSTDPRVQSIRQHLQRYRDLASQGKWAEAGRELDAIQSEVNK